MDIVIISQYLRDIEDVSNNNSRFIYLAKLLSENGDNKVEIITSDFMHGPKRHATKIDNTEVFKITALHEPGYSKNISLKRFYSHSKLAGNIAKYLEVRKKPDCIYCAVPSLDVAAVAASYCSKNSIRFIVDIQDLWPEAFKMVFNVPLLSDIIFAPMKWKADRIYRQADHIVAVSQTYVDRALSVKSSQEQGLPVFLGTKLADFDFYAQHNNKDIAQDFINVAYCGTLGASYDVDCIINALSRLKSQGYGNIRFIVMGDGARREEFIRLAEDLQVKATFTGMLPYPEMVGVLVNCDIAVNPIRKGSAGSIINKVGDYAMAGLPVINTQECPEYQNLLLAYNSGFNCDSGNIDTIVDAFKKLLDSEQLRFQMSMNSRKMGEDKFDRTKTYLEIEELICNKTLRSSGN